ncbi:MAG: DUF2779 domain-containing protein [Dehalococcoidales bacterium]|nr:DUF2779 domain-containing protein [Dehalococcoidales bacterium]
MPKLLSKSRYLNGLQCLKYLWLVCNDPEKIPFPDASTQQMFDQGHLVGALAKKLYPDGINIPDDNFKLNLELTRKHLSEERPLFEAGFMAGNLFARLDILKPAGANTWNIIEVKSATSVKEENYHDLSFQKLCAEKSGLVIDRCYLAFINNQYVRKGEICPAELFTIRDITGEVEEAGHGIEERIASMLEVISSRGCPDLPVGAYCNIPYACPVASCWEEMPENNIFTLYRGGKKSFEMYYNGILKIKDIPPSASLTRPQEIQKWCDVTGVPHVEEGNLRGFLNAIRPPVHYLDFETINPAIPLYDGVRPYQRIPFQFSLHIAETKRDIRHYSFLADGADDPRPLFLEALQEYIGPEGSIVTYNQSFEEGVLKELAGAFPACSSWIDSIRQRLVDLLAPFQSFHYYHPAQSGSASIKKVLPALTGEGYEGMPIAEGEAASRNYLNITFGDMTPRERARIRSELEQYCGLDTEGMVRIMGKLKQITGTKARKNKGASTAF